MNVIIVNYVVIMVDKDKYQHDSLTPLQCSVLEGFTQTHLDFADMNPRMLAYFDEASAFLKDELEQRYGITLSEAEDYYAVMAGLGTGTAWQEGFAVRENLPIRKAGTLLRASLARLTPPDTTIYYGVVDMAKIKGDYEEVASLLQNALGEKHGLDLNNPRTFELVSAGLTLGTEWVEGITDKGLPLEDAGWITRASLARLYPLS